jgi:predicted nucleotidyltransferase component of viral defense system
MLSANRLRQVAARSGARDIANVEIDVLLTHLLQLFHEKGLMPHLAFKGGTMLRKMVFGPRGRLSTDLDFTCSSDFLLDDLMVMMLDALADPYHGITFHFDKNKDWYLTDDGGAANPICWHADNAKGVKIKLQVSTRERPVLPVNEMPQVPQDYFRLLPFQPVPIPCLAFEEIVAAKIRAASQRSKIRDLYDLSELATRPLQRDLIRSLAVLKLWNSGGPGLDFDRLRRRIQDDSSYDIADLCNLLRKDLNPDQNSVIRRVIEGFQFLANLTDLERELAADPAHHRRQEADDLLRLIGGNQENG